MFFKRRTSHGFTLMELLIVVAILALLIGVVYTNWSTQVKRAVDARRKGDLFRLKAALENYQNDFGCYPAEAQMSTCGQDNPIFSHYSMTQLPCQAGTNSPYLYQLINPVDACAGYRMYIVIGDKTDPDITRMGCDRTQGCGASIGGALHPEYNYGVSMGGPVAQ